MPRIARLTSVGYPHYITQRGNNRQQIFLNDRDRAYYVSLLAEHSSECMCDIYAFCLMENNVHLVLLPKKEHSLAKMMQKISLRYTQHFNNKYRQTGRLWECRFHSAIIDPTEYLWPVCRYVERNPLRQRMVSKAEDYTWSSANTDTSAGFIKQFRTTAQQRKEYAEYLQHHDTEEDIRHIKQAVISNRPIGSETFIGEIEQLTGVNLHRRPRGRPPKGVTPPVS